MVSRTLACLDAWIVEAEKLLAEQLASIGAGFPGWCTNTWRAGPGGLRFG